MTRRASSTTRSLVTILTATSPVPGNPSTTMIERAVASLGRAGGFAGCRHLIVCDGCAGDDPDRAVRYDAFKRRLRELAASGRFCTDVEVVERSSPGGLAGVIRDGSALVRTPYLFSFEHDWLLNRPIDTPGILRTFARHPDVKYIRLNKHRNLELGNLDDSWDVVLKPDIRPRPVPLLRTGCWSGNPHFARTSYYRSVVRPHLADQPGSGGGFEAVLIAHYIADTMALGFDRAQRKWGVFLYGRLGDPPVLLHMDGRVRRLPQVDAPTRRRMRYSFEPNWREWSAPQSWVQRRWAPTPS